MPIYRSVGTFLLTGVLWASHAKAFDEVRIGAFSGTLTVDMASAYIYHNNQAFGATTSLLGLPVDKTSSRLEGFVKPSLHWSYGDSKGRWYGGVSDVSAFTRGGTDGMGLTRDNPESSDLDELYLGWRYEDVLHGQPLSFDLSGGRQFYAAGDGFVIGDGHADQGHDASLWLGPRLAFDETVIARFGWGPLSVELFDLHNRTSIDVVGYRESLKYRGQNIQWMSSTGTTVSLLNIRLEDDVSPTRDGLKVHALRMTSGALEPVELASEYVWQQNREGKRAHAYYVESRIALGQAGWQPSLTLRHSEFSELYDALSYGYGGQWGKWFQGEIVGEYMLFNANEKVDMLKLAFSPTPAFSFGGMFYRTRFYATPEGADSAHFSDEVNIYADWSPRSSLSLSVLYGIARPRAGAQALLGDQTSQLVETVVSYRF